MTHAARPPRIQPPSRRAGRARWLLAIALAGLLGAHAHAAIEASHHAGAPHAGDEPAAGSQVTTSCPGDCADPAHHHGHARATCPACRTLGTPAIGTPTTDVAPALRLASLLAASCAPQAPADRSACVARGPPAGHRS